MKKWPIGITFVYILFMVGILRMVYVAVTTNFDLVQEDYYQKDMNYEQMLDKIEHTSKKNAHIKVHIGLETIQLTFPFKPTNPNEITGSLTFYRPSDKLLDTTISFSLNEHAMVSIPKPSLKKGKWILKSNWSFKEDHFYNEQTLEL